MAKVPTGMALMMKSFGFDPEEIQKQAVSFFGLVKEFGERLERIEKKLEHIGDSNGQHTGNGGPGGFPNVPNAGGSGSPVTGSEHPDRG